MLIETVCTGMLTENHKTIIHELEDAEGQEDQELYQGTTLQTVSNEPTSVEQLCCSNAGVESKQGHMWVSEGVNDPSSVLRDVRVNEYGRLNIETSDEYGERVRPRQYWRWASALLLRPIISIIRSLCCIGFEDDCTICTSPESYC